MTDLKPGAEFAGCRIEAVRGRGGMGVVYRGRELSLDRAVAIKLINEAQTADVDARRRFEREARLMASLDHPNVIPVYAAGEEEGHLYLVMRYVDGTDLQALLSAQGRLSAAQAARVVDQVGRALDAAHQHGLIHRDIKPSNVLISGDHAYLTDFGVSRLIDEQTSSTDVQKWIGTVDYMSPEQLRAESAGPRSDVYSLGCLLYTCLAGSPPFRRDTVAATITAHLHDDPPKVSNVPGVPKQFDRVIGRAMAKRPKDRYGSAGQLGTAALAAAQQRRGGPWRARAGAAPVMPPPVVGPGPSLESLRGLRAASEPAADSTDVTVLDADAKASVTKTVVDADGETRVARTVVMPSGRDGPPESDVSVSGHRAWRARRRLVLATLGLAVIAALVAGLLVYEARGKAQNGPLTSAEIIRAVHTFAVDYSHRDARSLSHLLTADVTRVDLTGTEHGRAAVLRNYEAQFTTRPVPTKYVLSNLAVTSGWAGRASGDYTLTVSNGGTLSGHVVFGLQRTGTRVQVALISTR